MIKITEESFGTLAICALRYCQGRQTYMPDLVRNIVKSRLKVIEDNDLAVMIDDCDFQESMKLYGDEKIDKPGWLEWRRLLMEEEKRRKNEQSG